MAESSEKKPVDPRDVELEHLRSRLAALEARLNPTPGVKPPPAELPEEYRGTRTYVVGKGRAWQGNRLFKAGELITVTNQRPARDWVPVEKAKKPAPSVAPSPAARPTRANDRDIG